MDKQKIKSKGLLYAKNAVLGFQHMFAMMGATILVPIICNLSISVTLLCAGFGTLIFHFTTKRKVPVFLGSSFAFVAALGSTIGKRGADGNFLLQQGTVEWQQMMGKVAIAVMIAGLVYVAISLLVKLVGVAKIRKLFPPVVIGPVIIVIGMNLAPTVFANNIVGSYASCGGAGMVWLVVLMTALTIVLVSVFTKGFFNAIPVLCGIVVGYLTALCCGMVNFGSIESAPWILFQPSAFKASFGFFKYLSFDGSVILAFAPLALVTCMEHIGDISANSVVCGKNFMEDPGLHRTLLGDGLATFTAGFLGGPPNTTYGENTAVLAITKNYNPNLIALAGCFAVFLGIFGKFGGFIGTIPQPVIGGASLLLFGMIAANGLKILVEEKVDFSLSKNTFVVSIILVVGIGMSAAGVSPQIGSVSISPLAIVTVLGILLNQLFYWGEIAINKIGKKENKSTTTVNDGETIVIKDEETVENSVADTMENTESKENEKVLEVESMASETVVNEKAGEKKPAKKTVAKKKTSK